MRGVGSLQLTEKSWRPRRDLNPCYRRESKQTGKRCNYKAAVALQCPVRKRWECEESLGTCTVLVPRRVVNFIAIVLGSLDLWVIRKNPKGTDCTARP